MNKENDEFVQIINLIETHKQNAYYKVNEELVSMYYEIGEFLFNKVKNEKWGSKTIDSLSKNILNKYPSLKGFTRPGLYRMMQFYETYKDNKIVSTLLRQISWSNNMIIFSNKSSIIEKEFYIRLCIKNNYSARELKRQIESHYYERYLLSEKNKVSYMSIYKEKDYPNTRILDQYSLEFLDLPSKYSEKDFQSAIVENLKDFILEIGKDFTFIGKEYRVTIDNNDYYIDLLFFNRTFSCLVAFELKIGKFRPEYVSKMNIYLEALDRFVKKESENPSIGVILCSSKNDVEVEFATSRTTSPTLVSIYKTKLINKKALEKKINDYRKLIEKTNI